MCKKAVLIVDDMAFVREMLKGLLENDYSIMEASNGREALEIVRHNASCLGLIIMDIVMPEMDGFEALMHLMQENYIRTIPVILITAEASEKYITMGYDLGASDVIQKPFHPNVVKKRVKNLIELYTHKNHLEELVQKQTQELMTQTKKLTEINEVVVDALSGVIEYRSLESGQHIKRIRILTKIILEQMALFDRSGRITENLIHTVSNAAAMHDIGKIAIPDSVLLKPAKLTPEEFEVMKTHTILGCEILKHFSNMENKDYLNQCNEICRSHHERWDGKGYPDGLMGDEIPMGAQVVSIVDVYDALTSKRVYKPAVSHEKAVSMILNGECGVFSPDIIKCFLSAAAKFERISRVYSDNGEIY